MDLEAGLVDGDLETGRAQASVFRHGVSEPSIVLEECIQRQRKR